MTDAEAATELDGVGETLAYARRLVESIDAAAAALQIASVDRELRQPIRNFGLHTRLDHAVDAIERVVGELRRRVPEGDAQ